MLHTLLESKAARSRRAGGTVISASVHTALIALAISVTARATPTPPPVTQNPTDMVFLKTAQPNDGRRVSNSGVRSSAYLIPVIRPLLIPPVMVPRTLPPIDLTRSPIGEHMFDDPPGRLISPPPGGGALASPADGVYTPSLVEKAAVPRPGNPAPVYPAQLRAAQIEGSVVARFIVDTTGLAEAASINFSDVSQPQFAEAVRQSLLHSRYLPAMVGGHAVRQLVAQRFEFRLNR